ncbi:MAG: hypothetical protein O9353_11840 [Bacteroidia bacterium]|nr:hypothetical protein [Bacteroidia bacterium]
MRAIFSIVSLLVVVAIVGILVKKQLGQVVATPPAAGMPAVSASPAGATPQAQSQQVQQQVKQAMEDAMQARPMPADDK